MIDGTLNCLGSQTSHVFAHVLDNINISEHSLLYKKSMLNIIMEVCKKKRHHVLEFGLFTESFVDDEVGPIIYQKSNEILTFSHIDFLYKSQYSEMLILSRTCAKK